MPTVVDFPLVPATPTLKAEALKSSARSFARVVTAAPMRRAACTSGMVSSTAAEVTRIWLARRMPLPSCGCSSTPRERRKSNRSVLRPWSSARSEPSTRPPPAWMIKGERGHATTADAAKKVISWGEHRRNLQASPMKCNAGEAMSNEKCRIAVVAPASRISPDVADKVRAVAGSLYPDGRAEIFFHPQCFMSHGHFAGDDDTRARAFLDVANDDNYDAVWFARGGYGSCRMIEPVMCGLKEPSRRKTYLGYSDSRHAACRFVQRRVRGRGAWSDGAGHPPGWW